MPPLYEYDCPNCAVIEVWQGIRERALDTCPQCDAPVERLISLPGGHVMEPAGHYVPAPGFDKKGRMNERKVSPREGARQEDSTRAAMMDTRSRGLKQGLRLHER